ncbi:protein unc-80 homolog isoform X2 [Branchiostoma lanceolatum]|uniref:protein unc-80 homolog isoform X2 n=1 Tax=Branchiostoma lanceolatum TaxID=7740 RepID=UPI0034568881
MKEETVSLMFAKTVKENMVDEDDGSDSIPAAVQAFLWRLTSPFVQSKLTKTYEGSCVTLERILVDKRLSGLPSSLQNVISSVPSWSLLNAALPHVMQGCAALLANRNSLGSSDRLRVAETKLLYTLHWILLDAPHEWYSHQDDEDCENLETKLFPLETIRNFVHLFAPLVNCIRENDLTFRLSKGIRIWKPMWEHRQPEVSCFCVLIKPKFTASMEHVAGDTGNAQVYDICEVCRNSVQDCQCQTDKMKSGKISSSSNVLDVYFDKSWHNTCKSNPEIPSSIQKQEEESQEQDISCATYFDVAVLQCLFKKHWSEDGVNWALQYLLQRLRSLLDAKLYQENRRRRSCSTPAGNIPTIHVTPSVSGQGTAAAAKDGKRQQASLGQERDISSLCVPEDIKNSPLFSRKNLNGQNCKQKTGIESAENPPLRQARRSRRYGTTTCPWNLPLPIEEESGEEGSQKNSVSSDCTPTSIPVVIIEDSENTASEMVMCSETTTKPSDNKQFVHQPASDPLLLGKIRRASTVKKQSEGKMTRNQVCSKPHKGLTRFSSLPTGVTDRHETLAECDDAPPKCQVTQSLSAELLVVKKEVQKSKSAGSPRQSPKITISRSATDTKINYHHLEEVEVCEVPGVACYIENDGKLSYDAIVHAIHQVVMSDSNLRISSIVLNIVDTLFDLEFISLNQHELEADSQTKTKEKPDAQTKTKEKPDSYVLDIVFRVIQSFSCPHGCSDGHRGSPGDIVRQQAQDCFTRLFQGNKTACTTHLQKWISSQPLATTVDFLHSWLGFCSSTPPSPFIPERRGSYYGQKSLSWTAAREDMEGIIIARCFKTLMKQILKAESELNKPGAMNCSLFFDVQQLMTYLKEFHGSTFRKILLSGLADATVRKPAPAPSQSASSGVLGAKNLGIGKGASGLDKTRKGHGRRDFFRKRFVKRSSSTSVSSSGSELEAFDNNGASALKASSVTDKRNMSITSVGSISEDDGSTNIKGKRRTFGLKIRLGAWKKSSHRRHRKYSHDPEEASEMQTFLPQPSNRGAERSVEYHLDHRRVGLRALANSQHLLARISRRRRGLMSEDKEEMSDQHSSGQQNEPTSKGRPPGRDSREKGVNADSTREGMHLFRFLLNSCQPGTVPDPELLAAMLYLEAPVVARAAVLLECAHFVHLCNRGDWPGWMRVMRNTLRRRTTNREVGGGTAHVDIQQSAAHLFFQWGEAVGWRLKEILHHDSQKSVCMFGSFQEEVTRSQMKKEDLEEDFMDEGMSGSNGDSCPYALKMAACQLLAEITTFLRETGQYLPKASNQHHPFVYQTQSNTSELVVDHGGPRQRWSNLVRPTQDGPRSSIVKVTMDVPAGQERKISFAGVDDNESIHSSSTTLANVDIPSDEKKISTAGRKAQTPSARRSLLRRTYHNTSMRRRGGIHPKRTGELAVTAPPFQRRSMSGESEEDHSGSEGYDMEKEETHEEDYSCTNLPWIDVIVQVANTSNFICEHKGFCHPDCYQRQQRSCLRLIKAVHTVYGAGLDIRYRDEDMEQEQISSSMTTGRSSCAQGIPVERLAACHRYSWLDLAQSAVNSDNGMLKYLQVLNPSQCALTTLVKAATVLVEDTFCDILPVAWELLLDSNQHVAKSAATLMLLSSVRIPEHVIELYVRELHHTDPTQRINAIKRWQILWNSRYHVWPSMEEGACFKIPPPNIDFTQPSPTIGLGGCTVADPPWMAHCTMWDENIADDGQKRMFAAAATSRTAQQDEHLHQVLLAEEQHLQVARGECHVTAVPLLLKAGYEQTLVQHDGDDDAAGNVEERSDHTSLHQTLTPAQPVLPSSISAIAAILIRLTDDEEVNEEGLKVGAVARMVGWSCLVDDPALFLKHFLENLNVRPKQEELVWLLRRLLNTGDLLPQHSSHYLFNQLMGLVMYYVRSPVRGEDDAMAITLSAICQVLPFVESLYPKDVKPILRKEHCEHAVLLTANVPSTKKVIVHGTDESCIPTQLPVQEDTQFKSILQDCLEFFNIRQDQHDQHFLADKKTNQLRNDQWYVRDYYFFKRQVVPQLKLVKMDPRQAYQIYQKQTFTSKLADLGRLRFMTTLLQSSFPGQVLSHVMFLQSELKSLPSFSRKSLDVPFALLGGELGKELYDIDATHKNIWIKLLSGMFLNMPSEFPWDEDISLFLRTITGIFLLHCDDINISRHCLAALMNTAQRFKSVFTTHGYQYILSTILQVYANNQHNTILCEAIQFCVKQFYLLHRIPFILQMFGTVAPLLEARHSKEQPMVSAECLFKLILSLGQQCHDPVNLLDLLVEGRPLQTMDYFYADDPPDMSVIEAMNVCITVVAYAADSLRSIQMLCVLEALVPFYMQHLMKQTNRQDSISAAKEELTSIEQLAVSMEALTQSCETFNRTINAAILRSNDTTGSVNKRKTNVLAASKTLVSPTPARNTLGREQGKEDDDGLKVRFMGSRRLQYEQNVQSAPGHYEFHRPREAFLNIIVEYFVASKSRFKHLRRMLDPRFQVPELLSTRSHIRIVEILDSFLRTATDDPLSLGSVGLQRYFTEMLPIIDWSVPSKRPALVLLLRKLERLFSRIYKRPSLRCHLDWVSATNLLKGVYFTLTKQNIIAHLPQLNLLVTVCVNLLLADASSAPGEGLTILQMSTPSISALMTPPPSFCAVVVRLAAAQIQFLKNDLTLDQGLRGFVNDPSQEKVDTSMLNLMLPLLIRVGTGNKDIPRISRRDILYAVSTFLGILIPAKEVSSHLQRSGSITASLTSFSMAGDHSAAACSSITPFIAVLGLKILLTCFSKNLTEEWGMLSTALQEFEVAFHPVGTGGLAFLDLMDFLVTKRPPVFVLLKPFLLLQLSKVAVLTEQEALLQDRLQDKLYGYTQLSPAHTRGNWDVLHDLFHEMKQLRDIAISGKGSEIFGSFPACHVSSNTNRGSKTSVETSAHPDSMKRCKKGLLKDGNAYRRTSTVSSQVYLHPRSVLRDSVRSEPTPGSRGEDVTHRPWHRSARGLADDSSRRGRAHSTEGTSPQASWEKGGPRGLTSTNKKMSLLHPTHFESGDYADRSPVSTKSYGGASFTGIAPIAEMECMFGLYSSDEGDGTSMRGSPTIARLVED